jgi:NADH-quinone oxidoreductase subunit J
VNLTDVAFLLSALTAVITALLVVSRRSPVYSVLFMLPFFLAMTALFVMLQATFVAAIQMIVYGGAILVVFLFVLMLINLRPEELRDDFGLGSYTWAGIGAGVLTAVLALFIQRGAGGELAQSFAANVPAPVRGEVFGSAANLAYPLFEKYLVPFELASVLIVVATLGAVLLSKKKV